MIPRRARRSGATVGRHGVGRFARRWGALLCLAGSLSLGRSGIAHAQVAPLTPPAATDSGYRDPAQFRSSMERAAELSYVTMGGRQGLSGKVLFEANVAPHLYAFGDRVGIELTPKILVRMRADSSFTVRGPSYMPRATIHLRRKRQLVGGEVLPDTLAEVFSLTFSHHSNGQGGPFYLPDSTRTINTETGSFTTNFVDIAFTEFSRGRRATSSSVGIRVYLTLNETGALRRTGDSRDQYGRYRLFGSSQGRVPFTLGRWPMNSNIAFAWQYILDRQFGITKFIAMERVNFSVSYLVLPEILRETGLYVQYYYGQDYYNILYKSRLNSVRVGVALNTGNHLVNY